MSTAQEKPTITNKSQQDIDDLLERLYHANLSEEDKELLKGCVEFSTWMPAALQEKNITISNLRRTLFGDIKGSKKTQKKDNSTSNADDKNKVSADTQDEHKGEGGPAQEEPTTSIEDSNQLCPIVDETDQSAKQSKGHGRLGHKSYVNAIDIFIDVEGPRVGDACPEECGGKLYALKSPGIVIRITGNPLANVTRYHLERLRCALCGILIKAPLPSGVHENEKYDARLKAELALQKYYMGMPFYRQQIFQGMLNFPLPDATQFELCEDVANCGYPVVGVLENEAANGRLIHQDDTTARILSVISDNKKNPDKKRTGMFTTGIIAKTHADRQIALFYTGTQHAGENLTSLLTKRLDDKETILQMCDALASNMPAALKTIICNCLAHGFRKFRDLLDYYPAPCLYVMHELGKVYRIEEETKGMSAQERLAHHRKHSKSIMLKLHAWLKAQLSEKHVEPNSHLGQAIKYMLRHWKKLRRFLTTPGAPLDNNIVEATLKIPIRIRKSAMFYKTLHGAEIGNVLMSLIVTAKLSNENPIEYLIALQENKSAVFKDPAAWVPWSYRETLRQPVLAKAA